MKPVTPRRALLLVERETQTQRDDTFLRVVLNIPSQFYPKYNIPSVFTIRVFSSFFIRASVCLIFAVF